MNAEYRRQDEGARIIALSDYLRKRRGKPDGEPPPHSAPVAARRPVAPVFIEAMAQEAHSAAAGRFVSRYAA